MSLQDEMLEQNGLYQATMQENEDLRAQNMALQVRSQKAESLLIQYHAFCARLVGFAIGGIDGTQEQWTAQLADMQKQAMALIEKRAKAALQQE